MHELEPYWNWRDLYTAEEDERSPFFGRAYSEFEFSTKLYNYYLHPQWDEIGSPTLYLKIIFADYDDGYAIVEMIGEWNDAIHNDIMFFKREVIDKLIHFGIFRFILIGENILNFHADDDSYYEEWLEDIQDQGGWVAMVNFREHVIDEMRDSNLHYYLNFNENLNDLSWRKLKPDKLIDLVEGLLLTYLGKI